MQIIDNSIYRFIFRYSGRQQIILILLSLAAMPVLYASLELPKLIINEAIAPEEGHSWPKSFLGHDIEQIPYLLVLSGLFLALVLINGIFKYIINVYKGRLGEDVLRRLRRALYERLLSFPIRRFRRTSSGEMVPIITAEVEPLGGFIGDSVALPMFQGGTLCVYILFIYVQNPWLGLAATAFYPLQAWLIPRLQRRVNMLMRKKVQEVRRLGDNLSVSLAGIQDINIHGNESSVLSGFQQRLDKIFDLRFAIYRRKFFIKFLNNFINQLTPFFFYSIGGYLVITQKLSFGELVAVLAAYKDLAPPWRELLRFYQEKEMIRVRFDQIVSRFKPNESLDKDLITANPTDPASWRADVGLSERSDQPYDIEGKIKQTIQDKRHILICAQTPSKVADVMADSGYQVTSSPYFFAGDLRENIAPQAQLSDIEEILKALGIYDDMIRLAKERGQDDIWDLPAGGGGVFLPSKIRLALGATLALSKHHNGLIMIDKAAQPDRDLIAALHTHLKQKYFVYICHGPITGNLASHLDVIEYDR